jgi:zeaxanthin glucosyltransferase
MAHYGFLCPPVPGHINPMATLARTLRKRGHRVTMFQLAELRQRIESEGVDFCALGNQDDTRPLALAVERLGHLTGLSAARFTIRSAIDLARLMFTHAPKVLSETGVDVAVIDQNEPAGGTVAEHLNLPFVSVANLPLNREPDIPPPFVAWPCRSTTASRVRNRIGYALADLLVSPLTRVLNAQRRQWHLPALRTPDDSFSRIMQICTMPRSLDFPRRALPDRFRYVGPFIGSDRPSAAFPWDVLDGRPLVYASFGTLVNRREELFRTVAEACSTLPVQLVLTAGGGDMGTSKLPGSPVVVRYAPQLDLLARSALAITHAGLNTVLEALYNGVPMVAIPITNDQPAVAARVLRSGAGDVVPLNRLSAHTLRAAIERVLTEGRYRSRAHALQQEILAAGGVERAADIVESVSSAGAFTGGSGG